MTKKHSINSLAAKARKRMASPPPEYFSEPDYSKPARRIVFEDLLLGGKHEILLYISPDRIDQYRCTVNGKPWLERAGLSRILAGLRKSIGRFSSTNKL